MQYGLTVAPQMRFEPDSSRSRCFVIVACIFSSSTPQYGISRCPAHSQCLRVDSVSPLTQLLVYVTYEFHKRNGGYYPEQCSLDPSNNSKEQREDFHPLETKTLRFSYSDKENGIIYASTSPYLIAQIFVHSVYHSQYKISIFRQFMVSL